MLGALTDTRETSGKDGTAHTDDGIHRTTSRTDLYPKDTLTENQVSLDEPREQIKERFLALDLSSP